MKEKDKKELDLNKLRTELSVRRTLLSVKRTLLSFISTSCVFVSLAFTYLKMADLEKIDWFVILMFSIGIVVLTFGVVEYIVITHQTKKIFKNFDICIMEEEQNNLD